MIIVVPPARFLQLQSEYLFRFLTVLLQSVVFNFYFAFELLFEFSYFLLQLHSYLGFLFHHFLGLFSFDLSGVVGNGESIGWVRNPTLFKVIDQVLEILQALEFTAIFVVAQDEHLFFIVFFVVCTPFGQRLHHIFTVDAGANGRVASHSNVFTIAITGATSGF